MGKCFDCGAETPLALRRPGLWSRLPSSKRGYLQYCINHSAEAYARRDAAIGAIQHAAAPGPDDPQPQPRQGRAVGGGSYGDAQPDLFGG